MFSLSCNLTKTAAEFLPIKITTKKVIGNIGFFDQSNYTEKSACEKREYYDERNYV